MFCLRGCICALEWKQLPLAQMGEQVRCSLFSTNSLTVEQVEPCAAPAIGGTELRRSHVGDILHCPIERDRNDPYGACGHTG